LERGATQQQAGRLRHHVPGDLWPMIVGFVGVDRARPPPLRWQPAERDGLVAADSAGTGEPPPPAGQMADPSD
jgi:hypothetical protein